MMYQQIELMVGKKKIIEKLKLNKKKITPNDV